MFKSRMAQAAIYNLGAFWKKVSGGFDAPDPSIGDLPPVSGAVWTWGRNSSGGLGLGDVLARSSPVQVGSAVDWSVLGAGDYHSILRKTDGTLWAWGGNANGELGLGTVVSRSSPVQVGALTTWSFCSASNTSLGILSDGTLWAWGPNASGQLGLGNVVARSSPVQVGALTTWKKAYVGGNRAFAIKTDGTLWAWGANLSGGLGLGDVIGRSSPVQVGALTTWYRITGRSQSSTLAVKTDGTLWGWGANLNGQLGLGDALNRSSPVQIGAATDWKYISCVGAAGSAQGSFSLAIKTGGTLWSWGMNSNGELGLGDVVSRSSPVQVGALTNWARVNGGFKHAIALRSDGTAWVWGANASGQLGLANVADRSSPVQVGAATTWSMVDAGYFQRTIGIK